MRRQATKLWRVLRRAAAPRDPAVFKDALPVGQRLGASHVVTGHLGAGGFGFTYLAARDDGRIVALKECFPMELCRRSGVDVGLRVPDERVAFDAIRARFTDEARILRTLDHPNIVRGGALIEANGTAYIEMDVVEGELLGSFISRWFRGLSLSELSGIADQLLDALDHIHSRGFIHKDISPDNIIIDNRGDAKLIDFGSAASISAEKSADPMLVVKAGYSPQEFYRTGAEVDRASDLYQLGATLRHCITGRRPVESITRLMAKAQGKMDPLGPMPRLSTRGQRQVLEPIEKAMAIMLADRMQTAIQWQHGEAKNPVTNAS